MAASASATGLGPGSRVAASRMASSFSGVYVEGVENPASGQSRRPPDASRFAATDAARSRNHSSPRRRRPGCCHGFLLPRALPVGWSYPSPLPSRRLMTQAISRGPGRASCVVRIRHPIVTPVADHDGRGRRRFRASAVLSLIRSSDKILSAQPASVNAAPMAGDLSDRGHDLAPPGGWPGYSGRRRG